MILKQNYTDTDNKHPTYNNTLSKLKYYTTLNYNKLKTSGLTLFSELCHGLGQHLVTELSVGVQPSCLLACRDMGYT